MGCFFAPVYDGRIEMPSVRLPQWSEKNKETLIPLPLEKSAQPVCVSQSSFISDHGRKEKSI